MEDVNTTDKQRRIFLSLSKLEYGPQEINSRESRLHFTFFSEMEKMRQLLKKKTEFILKETFSLPNFRLTS